MKNRTQLQKELKKLVVKTAIVESLLGNENGQPEAEKALLNLVDSYHSVRCDIRQYLFNSQLEARRHLKRKKRKLIGGHDHGVGVDKTAAEKRTSGEEE